MAIPFTQYLRPDDRRVAISIERDPEIEELARRFISAGGWYEAEHLATGHVSLTACLERPEGDNDIAIEVVPNGPEVPNAVDRLVRASVEYISAQSRGAG